MSIDSFIEARMNKTRRTPRQVVQFIEESFPGQMEHQFGSILLREVTILAAIVGLIDQIPIELITLPEAELTNFIAAKEGLRSEIDGVRAVPQMRRQNLSRSFDGLTAVGSLHHLLSQCPDIVAQPEASELDFISDSDLREDLRTDIESCHRFTSMGEWKAATVLGGSVIESLLLWRLQLAPLVHIQMANVQKPSSDLEKWVLEPMIEVSTALKFIEPETSKVCDVARRFRDLIHPGRALRLQQKCDQATSMSVIAAIALLIRDLPKSI